MTLDPTVVFMIGLQLGQWLAIYGMYQMVKPNHRPPQRRRNKKTPSRRPPAQRGP